MNKPAVITFTFEEILETYNRDNNENKSSVDKIVRGWFIENLEHMGWQEAEDVEGGLRAKIYMD